MNNTRRKLIVEIIETLANAAERLEEIKGEEEDYKESIPEQFEERISRAEEICSSLEEAYDSIFTSLEILENLED